MASALELARLAPAHGDVPVGALVVTADGAVVGSGHNDREGAGDPTAHAEVLALPAAGSRPRLVAADRLHPGRHARALHDVRRAPRARAVDRVVYGAADPKAGAAGSLWDVVATGG
jgi:tRNA(adenine34) deaminase